MPRGGGGGMVLFDVENFRTWQQGEVGFWAFEAVLPVKAPTVGTNPAARAS